MTYYGNNCEEGRRNSQWLNYNISSREAAESAFPVEERLINGSLGSLRYGIVLIRMDGKLLEFNEAYRAMLGYDMLELRTKTHSELTPACWHEAEARIIREQIIPRGYSDFYEKEYRRADGTVIPVELNTILVRADNGNPGLMCSIVRDISDRSAAKVLSHSTHQHFRPFDALAPDFVLESDPQSDLVLVLDARGQIVQANEVAAAQLGCSREELLSLRNTDIGLDLIGEDAEGMSWDQVSQLAFSGEPRAFRARLHRRDRDSLHCHVTLTPLQLSGQRMLLVTARDVSGMLSISEALRDSERHFRSIAEATFEGVVISRGGRILDCNDQMACMLGCTCAELRGRPVFDFVPPEWHQEVSARIRRGATDKYEAQVLCKDGSRRIVLVSARSPDGPQGVRFTAIRDITEERQAAADHERRALEFAQAQRLAELCEISAGVVHQLSQPISSISANISAVYAAMKKCLAQDCSLSSIMKDIDDDLKRARAVMNRLRALAHPERRSHHPISPGVLVSEVVRMIQAEAALHRVDVTIKPVPPLPMVDVDAVQMSQALLILMRNGVEAAARRPEGREVSLLLSAENGAVQIAVCDTGEGIAPEDRAKLFDPFFTRKPGGMGLGLRLAHRIVTAHGGTVVGDNQPGGGACFRITLPVAAKGV